MALSALSTAAMFGITGEAVQGIKMFAVMAYYLHFWLGILTLPLYTVYAVIAVKKLKIAPTEPTENTEANS